jgi:STAS-like domain of unknown function (DUF4325)
MTATVVNIARDFSRSPAGRYESDGPYSGEAFRERWLRPALDGSDEVRVELDGALGFGSSFLEEAFGGLVRIYGLSPAAIRSKIRIVSRIKTYEDRIWRYIDEARPERRG